MTSPFTYVLQCHDEHIHYSSSIHEATPEQKHSMRSLCATAGALCWVKPGHLSAALRSPLYEAVRCPVSAHTKSSTVGRSASRLISCRLPKDRVALEVFTMDVDELSRVPMIHQHLHVLARRRIPGLHAYWAVNSRSLVQSDGEKQANTYVDAVSGVACMASELPGVRACSRSSCVNILSPQSDIS
jgi:hypothetical protein